jgi:RimJ/RimL family protein N-acetyltransferase
MGAQDDEGPESPSVIVTRRLWLKLPDDDQAAAAEALAASPAVARDIVAAPAPAVGTDGETFVVVAREQRVVVGSAGYAAIADRPSAAEMALWIGEPHWGRGYGTEAAQGLIDRVFANPRIDVLWCSNRVINDRARRVVEKCGFQPRGNGMVRSPSLRGAYPVERFLLDRRNWASLKAWGAIVRPEEEEDGQRDNAA